MSRNLPIKDSVGVGVGGGVTSQDAPFIHVEQTANFPRYPSLAIPRRLVTTYVWVVVVLNFSASSTVLNHEKENNLRLDKVEHITKRKSQIFNGD